MIDNVKFQIVEKDKFENFVVSSKIIDLVTFINLFTSEINLYPKKGKYKNLDVSITLINAYINGSLHKFRNLILFDEDQNYNDFSFCQVKEVISYLTEKLKIENSTSLTNLEFGFNIAVDKNPQDIIDYNLLMYKNKHHNRDDKFSGKGDFKEFKTTDFSLKIYNKSKQYHLKEHKLRIELKIISKRYLQKFGIFKLDDLNEIKVIYRLYEQLLKEFDHLSIVDDFYLLNLPKQDKDNLVKFTNPNYWKQLKNSKSLKVFNRVNRDFKSLLEKYNLNKTKNEILEKLEYKFQELLNDCDENLLLSKIA
jgi:hypothetical protein